ncbi:MAG: DNA cytosine methyltransferase [Lewinellaceae bacterium]|nr:DNA cytosine methyltransferase [Lewinellaceae bacterium]
MSSVFTSIEVCAGAGGQAIGLERAGFDHVALVEIEPLACETLRTNRSNWHVIESDVREFSAKNYNNIDLLAGGVPCPPFSIAGKQLGQDDERDLFPEMIRLASECNPRAILIENVKGILTNKFDPYRTTIEERFEELGYQGLWKLVQASDFGVSQLRPRAVFVAFKDQYLDYFQWPEKNKEMPPTVGEVLFDEMASLGWEKATQWKKLANKIAPTLVGGSKKHGGADLGPTRARKAWATLGVNGKGLAEAPPINGFNGMPKLTLQMTAILQGFPKDWIFCGKKTPAYRQIGNAFPPPVASAIGQQIIAALKKEKKNPWKRKKARVLELNFETTL